MNLAFRLWRCVWLQVIAMEVHFFYLTYIFDYYYSILDGNLRQLAYEGSAQKEYVTPNAFRVIYRFQFKQRNEIYYNSNTTDCIFPDFQKFQDSRIFICGSIHCIKSSKDSPSYSVSVAQAGDIFYCFNLKDIQRTEI